jgi:hypothetical protein
MQFDIYTIAGLVAVLVIYRAITYVTEKVGKLQHELEFVFEATKGLAKAQKSLETLENAVESAKKNTYVDLAIYSTLGMAVGSMIGSYTTYKMTRSKRSSRVRKSGKKVETNEVDLLKVVQPLLQATLKTIDDTKAGSEVDKKTAAREFISNLSHNLREPSPEPRETFHREPRWAYSGRQDTKPEEREEKQREESASESESTSEFSSSETEDSS